MKIPFLMLFSPVPACLLLVFCLQKKSINIFWKSKHVLSVKFSKKFLPYNYLSWEALSATITWLYSAPNCHLITAPEIFFHLAFLAQSVHASYAANSFLFLCALEHCMLSCRPKSHMPPFSGLFLHLCYWQFFLGFLKSIFIFSFWCK